MQILPTEVVVEIIKVESVLFFGISGVKIPKNGPAYIILFPNVDLKGGGWGSQTMQLSIEIIFKAAEKVLSSITKNGKILLLIGSSHSRPPPLPVLHRQPDALPTASSKWRPHPSKVSGSYLSRASSLMCCPSVRVEKALCFALQV